jgi:hypothetical protein
MGTAVAVAVEGTPHLVLDEHYGIVEVGPAAAATFGPFRGRCLWDAFPGAQPLFQPYYEKARRTGENVEFVQFYDGQFGRVRAVPRGARLLIFWEMLHRLDLLTLDGLRTTLAEATATIEESEALLRRSRVRSSLRVVEGGR